MDSSAHISLLQRVSPIKDWAKTAFFGAGHIMLCCAAFPFSFFQTLAIVASAAASIWLIHFMPLRYRRQAARLPDQRSQKAKAMLRKADRSELLGVAVGLLGVIVSVIGSFLAYPEFYFIKGLPASPFDSAVIQAHTPDGRATTVLNYRDWLRRALGPRICQILGPNKAKVIDVQNIDGASYLLMPAQSLQEIVVRSPDGLAATRSLRLAIPVKGVEIMMTGTSTGVGGDAGMGFQTCNLIVQATTDFSDVSPWRAVRLASLDHIEATAAYAATLDRAITDLTEDRQEDGIATLVSLVSPSGSVKTTARVPSSLEKARVDTLIALIASKVWRGNIGSTAVIPMVRRAYQSALTHFEASGTSIARGDGDVARWILTSLHQEVENGIDDDAKERLTHFGGSYVWSRDKFSNQGYTMVAAQAGRDLLPIKARGARVPKSQPLTYSSIKALEWNELSWDGLRAKLADTNLSKIDLRLLKQYVFERALEHGLEHGSRRELTESELQSIESAISKSCESDPNGSQRSMRRIAAFRDRVELAVVTRSLRSGASKASLPELLKRCGFVKSGGLMASEAAHEKLSPSERLNVSARGANELTSDDIGPWWSVRACDSVVFWTMNLQDFVKVRSDHFHDLDPEMKAQGDNARFLASIQRQRKALPALLERHSPYDARLPMLITGAMAARYLGSLDPSQQVADIEPPDAIFELAIADEIGMAEGARVDGAAATVAALALAKQWYPMPTYTLIPMAQFQLRGLPETMVDSVRSLIGNDVIASSPANLIEDKIKGYLDERGYHMPSFTNVVLSTEPSPVITGTVNVGDRYLVDSVELVGIDDWSAIGAIPNDLLLVGSGMPYSEAAVELSKQALTKHLRSSGYAVATVDVETTLHEPGQASKLPHVRGTQRVALRFVVSLGERVRLVIGTIKRWSAIPESAYLSALNVKNGDWWPGDLTDQQVKALELLHTAYMCSKGQPTVQCELSRPGVGIYNFSVRPRP